MITGGRSPGAAACLNRGYSASACGDNAGERGAKAEASENAYVVCIGKGYTPSECSGMIDGDAPGQAACLNRGYSPSSCANK